MTDRLSSLLPLSEIRIGARFLRQLPGFLRFRIDAPAARVILRHRLARREDDFLSLAHATILPAAGQPSRRLLALTGCE